MRNMVEIAPGKQSCKEECCHYWTIESPNGPTSCGQCKYCGTRKEFGNFLPHSLRKVGKTVLIESSRSGDLESGNNSGDS